MKKISVIFGTRPEAIKLAPVVHRLLQQSRLAIEVCLTAQHRQMLDEALMVFGIKPDVDLNLMQPNQTLPQFTSRAITALDEYLARSRPDVILVQGDTTTVLAGALTAFYHKIRIGHVEAGLRTGDRRAPFPEEANRVLTSHLADFHFAPTESSRQNLLREGIAPEAIHVTGNTVIDALYYVREMVRERSLSDFPELSAVHQAVEGARIILVTGHRRESFGDGFRQICQGLKRIAQAFPDCQIVYPVHLNPNVQQPVFSILGDLPNVHLIEPLSYLPFVKLMDSAHIILTDSGGIQEEAPALGKPVLVMRQVTERPEAVEAGVVKLVGNSQDAIFNETADLLRRPEAYQAMSRNISPYGDGQAAGRIVGILMAVLGVGGTD